MGWLGCGQCARGCKTQSWTGTKAGRRKVRARATEELPTLCTFEPVTLCVRVCVWVEGLRAGTPRAFAELFASSSNAPDLGGGAEGEPVVTDGSSDLGYRSGTETHWATELHSLHTAVLSHDAAVGAQRCSEPDLPAQFMCVCASCDHSREDSWLPHAIREILPHSVRFFFFFFFFFHVWVNY